MFGKTQNDDRNVTGERDERLSDLLRQWPDVETGPGFNAAVWRRIRAAPAAKPVRHWDAWIESFLPHPLWSGAAVATVALVIGLFAGWAIPGATRPDQYETHALLHPRTLMGAYATLSERGHP